MQLKADLKVGQIIHNITVEHHSWMFDVTIIFIILKLSSEYGNINEGNVYKTKYLIHMNTIYYIWHYIYIIYLSAYVACAIDW